MKKTKNNIKTADKARKRNAINKHSSKPVQRAAAPKGGAMPPKNKTTVHGTSPYSRKSTPQPAQPSTPPPRRPAPPRQGTTVRNTAPRVRRNTAPREVLTVNSVQHQRPTPPPPGKAGKAQRAQNLNKKLKTQSPDARRATSQKNRIDPKRDEMTAKRQRREQFVIKQKRSAAWRHFLRVCLIFIIMTVIILGIVFSVAYYDMTHFKTVTGDDITIYTGKEKSEEQTEKLYGYSDIIRNSVVYVPMSEIRAYCSLMITGDANQLRYISRNDGNEYFKFYNNSNLVTINGQNLRLKNAVIFKSSEAYVPIEFFEKYVNGMTVTYVANDEKMRIEMETETVTNSGSIEEKNLDFTLKIKKSDALENNPEIFEDIYEKPTEPDTAAKSADTAATARSTQAGGNTAAASTTT